MTPKDPVRLALAVSTSAVLLALPVSIAGGNIALGVLSAVVVLLRRGAGWRRLAHPLIYALTFYYAASYACAALGLDQKAGFAAVTKDLHKLWVVAVLLLAFDRPPERAVPLLALSYAVICAAGIWQAATVETGDGVTWERAHAFTHPVSYAQMLVFGLLGALCAVRRAAANERTLIGAFLALCATALVLSQTRMALLGLAGGLGVLFLRDEKLRAKALWFAAAAAAVVLIWELIPSGGRTLRSLFSGPGLWTKSGELNHAFARYALWGAAVDMFRDRPWTGVGPGGYGAQFQLYRPGMLHEDFWGSAHNLYLHQLAERGLAGIAALLAVLGTMLIGAWKRAIARPGFWTEWSLGATAAFLVMNLTEVSFQTEQVAALLLLIWTAADAAAREARA